jgi:antitoxin component YwqK of YwqJK toxin-antitoxin module
MNIQGKYTIIRYYDNGQLKEQSNHKDGEFDGLHKIWNEDGQLRWEFNYKDGTQEGLQKGWHSNGQLRWEANYKDGEVIDSVLTDNPNQPTKK